MELVAALALAGILLALALPVLRTARNQWAVRAAGVRVANFYAVAREAAIVRARQVRVEFGADTLRAVFENISDSTFLTWPGPARRGVTLEASRAAIRIQPNGLGWGAANTKLILRRGTAAESLTTSRLGRMRRWP